MVLKRLSVLGAVLALIAGAAAAQEVSNNQVAVKTAWSVFEEADPKECWGVAIPEETVNTKDGRIVSVNRGDILLMVFFRPTVGPAAQVAFTGGYPFAKGSTVNLQIGDSTFEMFTDGEWAWPATQADDAKIVTAMKRGANAILTGLSGRGTTTKDTVSLLGFTAAIEEAEKRCAS